VMTCEVANDLFAIKRKVPITLLLPITSPLIETAILESLKSARIAELDVRHLRRPMPL